MSQLPSGTVTFLFTDIEGSTKLLERLRGEYATLLAEHYEILRAAFAKWNGHEIDTQGDAFFVTFPRAVDAIACVMEAQRALAAHSWTQGVTVRVRMGLHTGEPIAARTGYIGMDVHLAARIAAAGHGGQVLLSQTTRDLIYQDLPVGASLRDLGEHKLKDIRYAQPIFQLNIQGLPSDFPPLKAISTVEEPPAPGEPPFKGLQYFDEADADLFFGREQMTAQLVEYVREHRFLAVIGASGSGKSSIVRAGLIPTLRRDTPPWQIHVVTPTAHPLEALAVSLARDAVSVVAATTLTDDLARDPRSLRFYILKRGGRLLLIVDQFEELFTLCRNETERRAFVDNLLLAGQAEDSGTTIVMTLRADFYEHLAQYAALREIVSKHQEYIGPMNAEELRRAIEEPAKRSEWEFSPGLVDLILHDIGASGGDQPEPGALPLLSHALLETWKRRRGTMMTFKGYAEAGGVRGAIAKTAESVHQKMSDEQRAIARNIFLRLTELGEGTQDTRRRAAFSELIPPFADARAAEVVLKTLADARLITTSEGYAEVAHEALIREWHTLREWLNQNREGLRLHRHLTEAAQAWQKLNREPGELYRGVRLAQALEWAKPNVGEMNPLEREFLDASKQLAEREEAEKEAQRQRELVAAQKLAETEKRAASRLRRRAVYLALALGAVVVLFLAALWFGRTAQEQARIATSRELAAAAVSNLQVDPERSVLLALQALTQSYTLEAENALHRSLPALHLLRTLRGHTNMVQSVAVSPDGTRIAGAGLDGRVIIWDAASGKELLNFSAHTGHLFWISFSSDSKRIATASEDKTAKVWDAATGKELLVLTGHADAVNGVVFSPDGARLATACGDATAKIWDATTGKELLTLSGHKPSGRAGSLHPGGIVDIAFSPDGKRLATGGADGAARVWDVASGKSLLVIAGHTNEIFIAISPDGKRLATAGYDGLVKVWDVSPGGSVEQLTLLINHEQPARSLTFSPDGQRLAAASQDGAARVWDASSGRKISVLVGHAGMVDDVSFTPDGTTLVTSSEDKTVKMWELAPSREWFTVDGGLLTYSPDGKRIATDLNGITLRDSASGQSLVTLPIRHAPFIAYAAYSPDGSRLATASWDGTAKVWDATSGKELFTLRGHTDRVWKINFSPDGTRLVTASNDKTAKVWDAASGRELFTLAGHTETLQGSAYSPDGKFIVTASWDDTAKTWDAITGRLLFTLQADGDLTDVAFSPDGKRVAAGGNNATATIWDVSTGQGKELYTLRGHTALVSRLAFSSDGKYLATASFDGSVKVWNVASGEEWLSLSAGSDQLTEVAFSPDRARLATGGFEGRVRVYALKLEDLIALAKSRVTRTLTTDECKKYLHVEKCP